MTLARDVAPVPDLQSSVDAGRTIPAGMCQVTGRAA